MYARRMLLIRGELGYTIIFWPLKKQLTVKRFTTDVVMKQAVTPWFGNLKPISSLSEYHPWYHYERNF